MAGTVVWTAVGLVPIEDVREGDLVLVKDVHTGEVTLEPVVAEIVTENAALVELVLIHESGQSETLRTTDEHPFRVEGRGWVRADALSPGGEVETLAGRAIIRSVRYPDHRVTVYNLSVKDRPNYFVGPDGVWVHNCGFNVLQRVPRSKLAAKPPYRGAAPIGRDGRSIELHHPDPKKPLNVREMTYTQHRGRGNSRRNHPDPWDGMTPEDRRIYDAERRRYWAEQWDQGRFDGLPDR